jgi:hypothetical protein
MRRIFDLNFDRFWFVIVYFLLEQFDQNTKRTVPTSSRWVDRFLIMAEKLNVFPKTLASFILRLFHSGCLSIATASIFSGEESLKLIFFFSNLKKL